MEIGLSLGSNLGDRLANLIEGKRRIAGLPLSMIVAQSPVYETEPVAVPPDFHDAMFLNAVLIVDTQTSLRKMASAFRHIEAALGRTLDLPHYAPRPLDIDLIYADALSIRQKDLTIPHPRWTARRFVVQPLADVRPRLRVPGLDRTVVEHLAELQDFSKVTVHTRRW